MHEAREIRRRDPVKTKATILKESTELFAQKGYSGCSISDIISAAEVNKRMIYHYFGDKRGLYRSVILNQWNQLKKHFDEAIFTEEKEIPKDLLKRLIIQAHDAFFDYVVLHPQFLRLLQWEAMEGGEISRELWSEVRGPIFQQMKFLFDEAQKQGLIDKNFCTQHLVVTALGAISFYFTQAASIGDLVGEKNPLASAAIKKRKDQLRVLIENIVH